MAGVVGHAGRVKCIYIDPPYNTGNRDFVYNDRFVDANDSWRHSTWCEFMFQRLMLAKDLLRQDGVIFVSIDDNEVFALGMLMKRVFGEENAIGTIVWRNVTDNNPTRISTEHEYILAFSRSLQNVDRIWKSSSLPIKERLLELEEELANQYPNLSKRRDAYTKWFRENKKEMWPFDRYKHLDEGGIFTGSQSVHNPGKEGYRYDVTHPKTKKPCQQPLMGYRFPPETMDRLLNEGRIIFGDDHTKIIELKLYVKDYKAKFQSIIEMDTRLGANELRQLFPDEVRAFQFPKPSDLIKEILSFTTGPDDLVLDFFAGSGTTAHAVMKLNAEDGGRRRFILVSSTEATEAEPDKNLCRDVCAKRVGRAIEGYGKNEPLPGDFAYLRCRRIPTGELLEIEHAEVWTALQMIHLDTLRPFADAPFQSGGDDAARLVYVPRFKKSLLPALRDAVAEATAAIVYSWQPETLRQHLPALHVQHEAIPESLARRFGLGK